MLAFSWQGESRDEGPFLDLYVMQVDDGAPVRLTAEPGHELYPSWSPDGTTIAFASGVTDSFQICTVPLLGGPVRRLLTVNSPLPGLDWSPDGRTIAYAAHGDSSTAFRIHLLDLGTFESRPLDVECSPGNDDTMPAFSPDGSTIAFVRAQDFNLHEVLLVSLDGGDVERLSGVKNRVSGLDWASDHEIVLSAANIVDFDLWLADLDTGERTWLTILGRPAVHPTTANAGNRLIYGELAYDCHIWHIDLPKAGGINHGDEPLIASTRMDYNPVSSPDGESIAFISDRTGRSELWIADTNGDHQRRLTREIGAYLVNPCWSSDSRRIAFSTLSGDHLSIFVTDVETEVATNLSGTHRHELLMHWSSSGKWLYYRVQRDDAWEVWRRQPDTGHEEQISDVGYTIIDEIQGDAFLCWKDGEPGLWRMPASGGEVELLVSESTARHWISVTAVDEGLYFFRQEEGSATLGFYDWTSSQSDSLGVVPLYSGLLRVSPDRSRLLYDSTKRFEIDLMLAEVID
jgi:Tol biopolymer transport system component